MITEEMLRKAAASSCEAYVSYIERGYDPADTHTFSREFERKIEKLKRRARHPFVYHSLRRVASVVLAVIIAAGAWLAVDVEARETFFGWLREIYENYFVYSSEGTGYTDTDAGEYRPAWLPEGYSELLVESIENQVVVIYADEAGRVLQFQYIFDSTETDFFVDAVDVEQVFVEKAKIDGCNAELTLSNNPDITSSIVWVSDDSTAFYISGFLSESELISIAESVQKNK